MEQVKEFLNRPLFTVYGHHITVGVVVLIVVIVAVLMYMRKKG